MTGNDIKLDRYAIVSFGKKKENLLIALKNNVIGSKHATFEKHIQNGQIIFFHCNGSIWGSGVVVSNYYYDCTPIWDDNLYPHRFNIRAGLFHQDGILTSQSSFSEKMKGRFGSGWGFSYIFAPQP